MADEFGAKKICCGMSETLHLPLKAKWYEMIESGVKTEEYREIKPYWVQRLCPCTHYCSNGHFSEGYFHCIFDCKAFHGHMNYYRNGKRIGAHTRVKFSYGYTRRTMTFEIESITIGRGNPEWGAPDKEVFIIKLGKRI